MKILEIRWLDEEKYDAEVKIASSDGLAVWAFCSPCSLSENEKLQRPLFAYDSEVFAASDQEPLVQHRTHVAPWSYSFVGKLTNVDQRVINVEEIKIELDGDLPGDLKEGDWIQVTCTRLDVIE